MNREEPHAFGSTGGTGQVGDFAEDASQLRTDAGPHVMACLRNLAIARCAALGRSTSPPPYDTTPATLPGPWPPSEIIPR